MLAPPHHFLLKINHLCPFEKTISIQVPVSSFDIKAQLVVKIILYIFESFETKMLELNPTFIVASVPRPYHHSRLNHICPQTGCLRQGGSASV